MNEQLKPNEDRKTGKHALFEDVERQIEFKTQELSIALEAAQDASNSKSVYLKALAEDIAAPLQALKTSLARLNLEQLEGVHGAELETLNKNLTKIEQLVKDVKDISEIALDEFSLSPTKTDIRGLMEATLAKFQDKASKKGLELTLQIDDHIPQYLMLDDRKLSHILTNILMNSMKYTMDGGVTVQLLPSNSANLWEAKIVDTSVGFSPEQLAQFQTIIQSSQTNAPILIDNTMVDLSISSRIVAAMKGAFSIKSQLNQGSIVSFSFEAPPIEEILPSAPANLDQAANLDDGSDDSLGSAAGDAHEKLKSLKLLLVEDNQFNQILTTRILQKYDITPDIANNGNEALSALIDESYDVILMDLHMPVMDGLTATAKIRALKDTIDQPIIIALTANSYSEDMQACLNMGMNDYLSKPFTMQALINIINANLQ